MARHVSPDICAREYGISLNCTISRDSDGGVSAFGDVLPGGFGGDPDIAGVGVLGAFITITLFSMLLSIGNTIWWISKNVLHWKRRITHQEKEDKKWQISVSGFFEGLVLSCSDQQIFTGGAYAITLRYWKACSISAYHYNIIANMLLFTCATHLMAVTIAKHYWQHPYIAFLRIGVTTLVYIVTGIFLANQGSGGEGFPSRVPKSSETDSTIILPAACFLTGRGSLGNDITKAFDSGSAKTFFTGQIPGFTEFLVMSMFYALAVIISIGRFIRRGTNHDGKRNKFVNGLKGKLGPLFGAKRFFYLLFAAYLIAGVGIASWTVQGAFRYIWDLRVWVGKSKWIDLTNNGRNVEDDPGTFGQLVPLLLMALTVFTFLHLLAEKLSVRKKRIAMLEEIEQRQHSSDTNDGKLTQVNTGYFDQTPGISAEKSTGVGFAIGEIDPFNQTPGATTVASSNGPSPGVYYNQAQQPVLQPPHLQAQSRSQTWASTMTTGTTATQTSQHSHTHSQGYNQAYVVQQQDDTITPAPAPVTFSSTPSVVQTQPQFQTQTQYQTQTQTQTQPQFQAQAQTTPQPQTFLTTATTSTEPNYSMYPINFTDTTATANTTPPPQADVQRVATDLTTVSGHTTVSQQTPGAGAGVGTVA